MLVGATFPSKKGQVYFGRFYLGKRRAQAVICSHLLMAIDGIFGSMRQILDLPSTPGLCDNKPAGKGLRHILCGWAIKILPHTSGIKASLMPPSFRKCGEKSETSDQTIIFDNKTAGQ